MIENQRISRVSKVTPDCCKCSSTTTFSLEYTQEGDWRHLHEDAQYFEGWKAVVTVSRESEQSDYWLTVAFATSDLTARGIDADAYRECSALAADDRTPVSVMCGVYSQQSVDIFSG